MESTAHIKYLMNWTTERAVEMRTEHIEKMAAAYLLKTDIDPRSVELVEVHRSTEFGGTEIVFYFREREETRQRRLRDTTDDMHELAERLVVLALDAVETADRAYEREMLWTASYWQGRRSGLFRAAREAVGHDRVTELVDELTAARKAAEEE